MSPDDDRSDDGRRDWLEYGSEAVRDNASDVCYGNPRPHFVHWGRPPMELVPYFLIVATLIVGYPEQSATVLLGLILLWLWFRR